MDPMNRGPEEYGHDGDDRDGAGIGREGTHDDGAAAPEHLTPQDAPPGPPAPGPLATADFGPPAVARTVQVVSGDFLLTVNPVDGSEIEPCPPGEQPGHPPKHSAVERAERRRAAQPPVPPGPTLPRLPLLERQEERERLVRLLARGRSVRLTGPAGSGRTALLAAVAEDCADLAPDGVIRLSGYHRTVGDLLYDLFAAVHDAPLHRPDRAMLRELLRDIGAVVVLDDLEFGGAALEELLDATPECAFLVAATPDIAAPSPESHLEEVFLGGLGEDQHGLLHGERGAEADCKNRQCWHSFFSGGYFSTPITTFDVTMNTVRRGSSRASSGVSQLIRGLCPAKLWIASAS